jgi:hypothetical protein
MSVPIAVAAVGARLRPTAATERSVAAGRHVSDCEVGRLALDLLAFRTGKLRANERPVDGPVFYGRRNGFVSARRFRIRRRRGLLLEEIIGHHFLNYLEARIGNRVFIDVDRGRADRGRHVARGAGKRRCVFLASTGCLPALVGVLGVARRATRLFDIVLDHCDDGMIGHAPFTRTIVVQYVTETQPTLLHKSPRITD